MDPIRLIEPGATVFSAAEIRVAVIPVGDVPEHVMGSYASLITACRQVELANVRSFFNQAQKSPFSSFPWKTGTMHFHYVPQEVASEHNPLVALSAHKKVLGVIGLCFCPAVSDLAAAYASFEQQCRQFPDAMTTRCFAFEPTEEQSRLEDMKPMQHLMMFPPGDAAVLNSHTEVMMHDLAAALLGKLEHEMLTCSAAAVDLNTALDSSPDFQLASGTASALEAVSNRLYSDEEALKKRRLGRQRKAMGDYCLLAGTPTDARDHYQTAADLARASTDFVWAGAALEGLAHSKILASAVATGLLRSSNGLGRPLALPPDGQHQHPKLLLQDPRLTTTQLHGYAGSATSASSSASTGGFGGRDFWNALSAAGLESEVRQYYSEAKAYYRRRNSVPLQIEGDLKLARFLAGLDFRQHRREVSKIMTRMVDAGPLLSHSADHLAIVLEASQVMGVVGCARKRTLMLWRAVEICRRGDYHDAVALDIARRALEPPPDAQACPAADNLTGQRAPLATGVPRHWPLVRCGSVEGVLAAAILANQHSDVWDAAATLLREHSRQLSPDRQATLLEYLAAAANRMKETQRRRPGAGPPPLVWFNRPVPPAPHLQPRAIDFSTASTAVGESKGPFIFSALDGRKVAAVREEPVTWVAGEVATVEVDISNPTSVPIKLDKLTLEARHSAASATALQTMSHSRASSSLWKPAGVAIWIPAGTKPAKVLLQAEPLQQGIVHLSGCQATAWGVTWSQPWSSRPLSFGKALKVTRNGMTSAEDEADRISSLAVTVVPPLPLLVAAVDTPDCHVIPPVDPRPQEAISSPKDSKAVKAKPPRPDVFAPPSPLTVRVARGQLLSWQLRVSNPGRLAVTSMRVSMHVTPPHGSRAGRAGLAAAASVQVEVDTAAVTAALPLLPGTATSIPLHLHLAQVAGAVDGCDEVSVEVRIEYSAVSKAPQDPPSPLPSEPSGASPSPPSEQAPSEQSAISPTTTEAEDGTNIGSHSRAGTQPTTRLLGAHHSSITSGAGGGGRPEVVMGRTLSVPVHVVMERSLLVSTVHVLLRDVVEDRDPRASDEVTHDDVRVPSASCLLEVDGVSHLDGPLEVWLGRRHLTLSPDSLATWCTWVQSVDNRNARLVLPGRRSWVNDVLPSPLVLLPTSAPLTASPPAHTTAGAAAAAVGCLDGTRRTSAVVAAIVAHAALYWRRSPGGAEQGSVGVVALPPDLVAAALGDCTVSLLAPSPLALQLTLTRPMLEGERTEGAFGKDRNSWQQHARDSAKQQQQSDLEAIQPPDKLSDGLQQEQASDEDHMQQPSSPGQDASTAKLQQQQARGKGQLQHVRWQTGGQAPDGKLQPERWAVAVVAGEPLLLTMHYVNQGESSSEVIASLSSSAAESNGAGGGGGWPDVLGSPTANRAPDLHPDILTSGTFSGVALTAEGNGGRSAHTVGVCFLTAGLYILQPSNVEVRHTLVPAKAKSESNTSKSAVSTSTMFVSVR